jgi:riboflavin synthase
MFTGIIEAAAEVVQMEQRGTNKHFTLQASIAPELKVDQSLAHNGVCLTVVAVNGQQYEVTAIEETLKRTNLGALNVGDRVNLERCLAANGRLDGHIVQGHVDGIGELVKLIDRDGSWSLHFAHEANPNWVTVEKGSICVNGVSLTVVESTSNSFSVEIIPYTWTHTNLGKLKIGDKVNLEFDILGKYAARLMQGLARK